MFDKRGNPSPEVRELFRLLKLVLDEEASLKTLNEAAQNAFLRPDGSERLSQKAASFFEKQYGALSKEVREAILENFKKMGDLDARYPSSPAPHYILIHGSTVSDMRTRILFLASLLEEGKITLSAHTKLFFLLGDRELSSSEKLEFAAPASVKLKKGWKLPEKLPENETDLGEFLWNQWLLPEALENLSPHFIKAPKKAEHTRAQTEDCVELFIKEASPFPEEAVFLVISSNPFIEYQRKITELAFCRQGLEGFVFDAAGDKAPLNSVSPTIAIGVLMDNLARTLYTEVQCSELIKKRKTLD
ncbi:MAG: hypothetical protein ACRCYP_03420 [Alphaproteobacteria bacterium]